MDSRLTCEPCKHRHISSRAYKYCTTCQESLCKDCAEVHKSCKATRTHLLVQIEDHQSSSNLSKDLQIAKECKEHKSKQIEFYCADHEELLCTSCLLTNLNHRDCKTIVQLTSIVLDTKNKSFTDKIFNDSTKAIVNAENTQTKLEETLKKSQDGVKDISERLNNVRDRFIALFDEQKNEVIKHAEEMFSKQRDQCNQMLANIREHKTSVEESEIYLREIVNSERGSDVFHCIMLTIDKIEDLKKQTEDTCQHSTIINISLEDSPFLQMIDERASLINCKFEESKVDISNAPLNTTSKDDFYEHIISCKTEKTNDDRFETSTLKTTRKKSMDECIQPVMNDQTENENYTSQPSGTVFSNIKATASAMVKDVYACDTEGLKSKRLPRSKSTSSLNFESAQSVKKTVKSTKQEITFKYTDKFDVSSVACTDMWFGGIVCLSDDRIVLSDYLNKRLVILRNDHQMKDTIPLKYCPGYLSLLGDDFIIVCLMKTNQVLLLNVMGGEIEGEAYLQTRFHPKCAQGINGEKVLVSMKDGCDNWFMDILKNDGTMEQTIQVKEFYDGYKIAIQHLSDKDTDCFRIIQYCDVTDKLRGFTLSGETVFSYDIDQVTCVLTDRKGFIFIVRHTGEVQVLSPDGKYKGHIHRMSMYKAKFSALSSSMDRIYITKYKDPTVHVLKVCRY
ncbi:uncharacterized protein LOC123547318 [Mercenaria mercenaria]|uniref:uncharacterized protein LOC123547318 n=1 Tax=Mercenaria mercenaria TaxID=6596 RepID=UPI00234E67DD|nr:uncharacterized protein LOC123547318 [Mercenaria mercenaria]XP_053407568.1 uncharacterized protein LOC123547318 [Mercenaria mercenaria]